MKIIGNFHGHRAADLPLLRHFFEPVDNRFVLQNRTSLMNYPGLKPVVSQVKDLKYLRFAPGGHSSPSLKARVFWLVL